MIPRVVNSDESRQMKNMEEQKTVELIELFRKYGGKFENIVLGYSEESGFYCHTSNSNQNTIVSCPANLLVDCSDVGMNQDGLFIANPDKYKNSMEFLEKYFAFHFDKTMLNLYLEKKIQIDSLSNMEMSLVSRVFPLSMDKSGKLEKLEFARRQILNSHNIGYFGRNVLMPFVTFLNHDKNGRPYAVTKKTVSVSGKFSNEVFAVYNSWDVLMIAHTYGFTTDTRFAYSIPLSHDLPNGKKIIINRSLKDSTTTEDNLPRPLIQKIGSAITVSWFPLFIDGHPTYPARIAQLVAAEIGLTAEGLLYDIFRYNLNALVPAAFQLSKSKNQYAQQAGAAAQRQLEVISGTKG